MWLVFEPDGYLEHAGYAYPDKIRHKGKGDKFVHWPDSYHGPDDGSEHEQDIYHG